jgi:putative flippase GtrA
MTTTAHTAAPAARASTAPGPLASFLRFVLCGGGVTVAASFVLALMSGVMPFFAANIVVTVVSTVVTTELHARVSFRSAERGWRVHMKSAGTVAVSFAFTTAAVMVLHLAVAAPGVLTEQAVYLAACGLAGLGRFAVLRVMVFAAKPAGSAETAELPVPAAAGITRGAVAMAA